VKKFKRWMGIVLTLCIVLTVTACGSARTSKGGADTDTPQKAGKSDAKDSKKIGVAMPTKSSERWIRDGGNMKKQLEKLGYTVDLQFAEDDVQMQVSQIENMIASGAKCLVIASIDSSALVNVLDQAKRNDIPVIAYDRLLMDTDAVSYYATFDNKKCGTLIGEFIEEKMGLKDGKGPFNIEFFAGSPDDNNAHFLNDGMMEVLKPYLDNGKLKVLSGQTDFNKICILRWSQETAQNRMDDLLSGYYSTGEDIDIVGSAFDGFAYGIAAALEGAGYKVGEKWPVITGQDADKMAIKNIRSGKQSMTLFKDTRVLAKKCVTMVQAVMEGKKPEINDTTTYDNGKLIVPSYLCTPVAITKDNIQKELIDSGYYKESDIS